MGAHWVLTEGWVLSGCRVQSDCRLLQGGFRVAQGGASLLCKALCCRLAVEPVYQLERVDGHEYPAGERVDLVLGEAYPRVVQDGRLVEVH